MKLMHDLARLSAAERRRIVTDFVDDVFAGLDADPGIVERMRMATPELPDEPSSEQVQAWIELAELVGDPEFRAVVRAMAQRGSDERAARGLGRAGAATPAAELAAHERVAATVAERAGAAVAAGIDPASPEAQPIVDELASVLARLHGTHDGPAFRATFADTIAAFGDSRVDRYWRLLAIINGWPQREPSPLPAWEWLLAGLRAAG
jgi:pyruvate/2-oxoglutarate dehydrogenase complex dihydrolipoamide acyltransferase (E2) component